MVDCPSEAVGQEAGPPQVLVFGRLIDVGIGAMDILQELDVQGRLMIHNVIPELYSNPHEVREAVQEVIGNCRALICRPSRGGKITAYLTGDLKEPFHIATISKGIDHIQTTSTSGQVNIIRSTGEGNGPAVAELAMILACLLLRPVHRAAWGTAHGDFKNSSFDGSRQLEGLTWACIGSGAQVSYLLERLLGWRLNHLIIFHPEMNETRLQACVAGVARIAKKASVAGGKSGLDVSPNRENSLKLTVTLSDDTELTIEGTRNLADALSRAEIVSIHVPLTRDKDDAGRAPTLSMFDEQLLNQMKKGSLLINVSRGDIVVEGAILDAIRSGTLFGYGSDVINQEAEDSADPADSVLWSALISDNANLPTDPSMLNLILTPHIGGNTVDAINAVADDVVNRLLEVLGVPLDDGAV